MSMGRRCVEDRENRLTSLTCRRAPQDRGWIGALRRGPQSSSPALRVPGVHGVMTTEGSRKGEGFMPT